MWHNDAGAADTFTCANDSTIGNGATWIVANEDGGGDITIAQGIGVTIRWWDGTGTPTTGNRTLAEGGICAVYKYTNTEYWVWGMGLT